MFKALLIEKNEVGQFARLAELDEVSLPEGDVTVSVEYSSLNYKDALAITGKAPVVRRYPMVPGIDLAGRVQASTHPHWQSGDRVLLNGFGLGEIHWGGLAQKARVKGDWLVAIPEAFSSQQVMAIGTAGYTAMLCVMALQRYGVKPEDGEILVTGANGGVGGIAVMLLAKLGYAVTASTGRLEASAHLQSLGATQVIDRQGLSAPGKPLDKERWAAAIDSLGGQTLANICAGLKYRGVVAACGLAESLDFPASVAPFILRGITLMGIDSVYASLAERQGAWQTLAELVELEKLESITEVIGLAQVEAKVGQLLAGQVRGRVVVDVRR